MSNTILITGAGSGIGRASAQAFLAAGWRVGLIGRRADPLTETAGGNPGALVLPCDVTNPAQVDADTVSECQGLKMILPLHRFCSGFIEGQSLH